MGCLLYGKTAKIVIFDQARVNGGNNYELPGQRWAPKLVYNMRIELSWGSIKLKLFLQILLIRPPVAVYPS